MKKQIFALTAVAALTSGYAIAADTEEAPDMSDPTAAYTAIGAGYGNEGANLKIMYMNSDPNASQKTGYLLEFNDIFDAEGGENKFAGFLGATDETTNRNFRFRYGSINTENGLGNMVDAVIKDHPFFGTMTVAQVGALATIPLGDNAYIWPVILFGGVIVEDNTPQISEAMVGAAGQEAAAEVLAAGGTPEQAQAAAAAAMAQLQGLVNMRSSGVDFASTVYSFKTYARYKFTDNLWVLGAYTFTDDMSGKEWEDDISEGGLQISPEQLELTLGYQLTPTRNFRLNYHHYSGKGTSDKVWLEYNHAF